MTTITIDDRTGTYQIEKDADMETACQFILDKYKGCTPVSEISSKASTIMVNHPERGQIVFTLTSVNA